MAAHGAQAHRAGGAGVMVASVMYSSASDNWATPQALFNSLNAVFKFDLDAAAAKDNAKCQKYFTVVEDGLTQDWIGNVWLNPPYGRQIGAWVKKAYDEVMRGGASSVVLLLPARTDTTWFHDYCKKGIVFFLRGRLKFGNARNSAPFPSMIVIFARPFLNTMSTI